MKLTDKELLRRIRITKPGTVKRAIYALIYVARLSMFSVEDFKK